MTVNVPLSESDNERARGVADLYRKLTVNRGELNPAAARYVRRNSLLTEDVAADWEAGYLSRSTGEDRSGGTLRGRFVIAINNRDCKIEL